MIITLIMDQYGAANNGTTITTRRFAEVLREKGHTVRIVSSSPSNEPNVYQVPEFKLPPIADGIIKSQGMVFAKADEKILREAIKGSDIVHLLMPFGIQRKARLICEEEGVPCTAAFHVQPENITYTIHLGKNKHVNNAIYKEFYKNFYRYFNHIHTPSQFMKDQMLAHGYTGNIHAISNGVADAFKKQESERPLKYKDQYLILMIGRYSREKRQDLIIKAIAKSKYKEKIHLILCGKGPWEKQLRKLADKYIGGNVTFTFLDQPSLVNLINYCDLYVHASDAESEAISCMEAFSCGLVPIISDSKNSATNQFALTLDNLFKCGDPYSLAQKIDYLIENPELKKELSAKYLEFAKKFRLEACVTELENVFYQEIKEYKERNVSKVK